MILHHDFGMWNPNITKMPGFMGNAGEVFFSGRIALYKPIVCCFVAKDLANATIWKGGANKINVRLFLPKMLWQDRFGARYGRAGPHIFA